MDFLPVNINIRHRKILLVGGGRVALHKATILLRFVEDVTVLAPRFAQGFEELPFRFIRKSYEKGDLRGYHLLYICTDDHGLNREIKEHARELGIPASVCDAPALCDFTSPAIFKQDNLTISVATDGREVKRAIAIRNRIEELIKNGILQID